MKLIIGFGFVLGAFMAAGEVVVTKVGETVTLECGVDTFTHLQWCHKDVKLVSVNGKTGQVFKTSQNFIPVTARLRVKQETKIVISKVTEADAGQFTCEADKKTYQHSLIVVSVSVTPSGVLQLGSEAILHCGVTGLTPGSMVQWKGPAGRGPSASPTVQLKPVAAMDGGIWQCTFSCGPEIFSENVTIQVDVLILQTPTTSLHSEVTPITCDNCIADPPPTAFQQSRFHWWKWVTLVSGCLVLIGLVIFAIIFYKKFRKAKRHFQRTNTLQQPLKPKHVVPLCDHPTDAAEAVRPPSVTPAYRGDTKGRERKGEIENKRKVKQRE
ncbi:T-cell surface glycoprotein CD4-like isoform X2 [Gouania willdenowi]|uniref:T-cell surface glycoprotein CD4-like isoform X2 n=1 Tax=Gouania willdenowi TaxID=441366 RepID=UPI001054672F|nr:T-cell surface glycoprotein CD4-like isoform X2 [Gouania willdenowi]XP_028326701.1 T-cell surface glycoprotein CD4-like isoform X2 [Gouania willdenowi]